MSGYHQAVEALESAGAGDNDEAKEQALALFATHTNLTAVLGLLQRAVNEDDLDKIDQQIEMLAILAARHRRGHS